MAIKILIALLLLGFGCSSNLGATNQQIDAKIIELSQVSAYKEMPWTTVDGVKYKVDEYQTPKGERGYWITAIKEVGGVGYSKVIAEGVDKTKLEHDWREEYRTFTNSTSTL